MAQKRALVPGLGEVILSKRKGTRNIRLSVNAKGEIRVGMPSWVPYAAGVKFALSRKDWLNKHAAATKPTQINPGSRIGKSYRVAFDQIPSGNTTARISGQFIKAKSSEDIASAAVQAAISQAAERALKKDSEKLLPQRLEQLAHRHGYKYRTLKIKKMTSRWGSCASDKTITLSYFLIQLPWELIDYVILHELAHTKQMNHSLAFWAELESACPGAHRLKKEIKQFRPVINSVAPAMA